MDAPLVSVIVPVYNAEKYLSQCLDSIVDQSLSRIEIVLVDDGSFDSSPELLARYAEKDKRVRVIRSQNKGAGAARNEGLAIASGKYLSFLDADDFFEADMLEAAFNAAERDCADVVAFGGWLYDEEGNANRQASWFFRRDGMPSSCFSPKEASGVLFDLFGNYTWNKLFKRDFILAKGIKFQEIERTNDLLFTCSALFLARKITALDKAFVHYRVTNHSSLQSTNDRSPLCFVSAFRALKESLESNGAYSLYEGSFVNHFVDAVVANCNSMKSLDGLRRIKEHSANCIEPEFNLSEGGERFGCDADLLDQYRMLLDSDLDEYLFFAQKKAQYALDDNLWYTDWLEWDNWNSRNKFESEIAEMKEREIQLSQNLSSAESERDALLESRSYRIGRAVTAPIRAFKKNR